MKAFDDGLRIQGRGIGEEQWRQSPWLEAVPVCAPAAWLAGVERLVVVAPHPDDEVLGCGGLMHVARRLGVDVCVVSVTDGEACYPETAWRSADALRDIRRRELRCALARLGVDDRCIVTLDLGDGRVREHEDDLVSTLGEVLRPGDRTLTTWRHDGHPDHEAVARAVVRASTDAGTQVAMFPVWAWHWLSPSGHVRRLPGACRLALDAEALAAKAEALACFGSQLDSGVSGLDPILPADVLARFARQFEVVMT